MSFDCWNDFMHNIFLSWWAWLYLIACKVGVKPNSTMPFFIDSNHGIIDLKCTKFVHQAFKSNATFLEEKNSLWNSHLWYLFHFYRTMLSVYPEVDNFRAVCISSLDIHVSGPTNGQLSMFAPLIDLQICEQFYFGHADTPTLHTQFLLPLQIQSVVRIRWRCQNKWVSWWCS